MNDTLDKKNIEAVRALYEKDEVARQLFDWTAARNYAASETSIDRLTQVLRISRKEAVQLARDIEHAGCGQLIVGRRGRKSRFRWAYNCISLGMTAAGETDDIEEPLNAVPETGDDDDDAPQTDRERLTIQKAKELLAESLELDPDQIAIEIRV